MNKTIKERPTTQSAAIRFACSLVLVLTLILAGSSLCCSSAEESYSQPSISPKASLINSTDVAFVQRWFKPGQYMGVSEIKPGMKGYGLTVFHGTKVEKFNVEVIGVVKKLLNGRDAILVRLSGGPLGTNNVIKGMSGSPVYINGKLVGAVSFGYDFSKEPIAGITPIVDMLDALAPGHLVTGHIAKINNYPASMDGNGQSTVSSSAPKLIPLVSPIALVGFSPRAEEFLAERFRECGMTVSSGAAGGQDIKLAPPNASLLQPGSAVSVLLSTGDFNTVATGTLTARFGNKIIAFGHPFLQAGAVDFPMSTAYVHQVLPSLFVSFKVASPGAVVGSVVADRPWSVGGQIGSNSKLIPATYTVTDETRHIRRVFHCQVVDHPDLTPELLAATTISAIDATHQSSGPYVARVESSIEAEGVDPIHRVDRFSTNFTPHSLSETPNKFRFVADPVGSYVLHTISEITNNDFQKCSIKSLKLNITLQDGHETATIDKVYIDKPFVAPGDPVTINCLLKPYNKKPVLETLTLNLPKDLPDGNLLIGVGPGDDLPKLKKRMGISDPSPESLKQITARIIERGRGDALSVVAALPQQSLIVSGYKLTNPPTHWSRIFFSNRHTRWPSLVRGDIEAAKETDWLLDDSHLLTVEVRNPDKVASRQAPYTMPTPKGDEDVYTTEEARKTMESLRKSNASSSPSSSGSEHQSTADKPTAPRSTAYPHMRAMLSWRQNTEPDFRSGKTKGSTIDSWGRLSPGYEDIAKHSLNSEMQIWSGTWSKGYFWFATKDQVWRWQGSQLPPESVSKLDSVAIPAMTCNSKGTVYFATIPDGKVWALSGNGSPRLILKTAEPIITSLCTDEQDNLFVGVAGTGKIYKVDAQEKSSIFFDSGQTHIVCLFYSLHDKMLYAGTGEKGCVYKLDDKGKATALYQSADHLITGIVQDSKADLYVATAGQGELLRILPSGDKQVLASSEAFYKLYYDPQTDRTFSGDAEGDITCVTFDPVTQQPYFVPVCHTEQEAVLVLAADEKQRLFAATSNLAEVIAFKMQPARQASYESPVHDAGRLSRWSYLKALGAFNETDHKIANEVKVQTRSGDTSQPDDSWSSWQETKYTDNGYSIASPQARYLQYRLSWSTLGQQPVTIGAVEVSYMPADTAPKFGTISLKPASALSGKYHLSLSGLDPDADNLLLSIQISGDGAKTWQTIASDLRAKHTDKVDTVAEEKDSAQAKESDKADKDTKEDEKDSREDKKDKESQTEPAKSDGIEKLQGVQNNRSEKEDQKNMSKKEEIRTKNHKSASNKTSKEHDGSSSLQSNASQDESGTAEKFSFTWDTSKQKDGNYIVKLILDDRLSNAEDNLRTIALRSVNIHNTQPEIEFIESKRMSDGTLKFKVGVKNANMPIANATYKIDDAEPYTLAAQGGQSDGGLLVLEASGVKVGSGSHKIEVKISDQAGNSATKSFSAK